MLGLGEEYVGISSEEVAALNDAEKLGVYLQDAIISARLYLKAFPNNGGAPAVILQVIKVLSHSNGYYDMSARKLGELLGRKEGYIRKCIDRLVSAGFLREEQRIPYATRYWPVIYRTHSDNIFSPEYLMKHFAPGKPLYPHRVKVSAEHKENRKC